MYLDARNGMNEGEYDACFGSLLTARDSHTALTQKRHLSGKLAFVWYLEYSRTPFGFWVTRDEEERKKKERRKKDNKIENFKFVFLNFLDG